MSQDYVKFIRHYAQSQTPILGYKEAQREVKLHNLYKPFSSNSSNPSSNFSSLLPLSSSLSLLSSSEPILSLPIKLKPQSFNLISTSETKIILRKQKPEQKEHEQKQNQHEQNPLSQLSDTPQLLHSKKQARSLKDLNQQINQEKQQQQEQHKKLIQQAEQQYEEQKQQFEENKQKELRILKEKQSESKEQKYQENLPIKKQKTTILSVSIPLSSSILFPRLKHLIQNEYIEIKELNNHIYSQMYLVSNKQKEKEKLIKNKENIIQKSLKIVRLVEESDLGIEDKTLQEIVVLKQLKSCPNIISLNDIQVDWKNQSVALLLEPVECDLDKLITIWFSTIYSFKSKEDTPKGQQIQIAYDIVCGISNIHANGLLHFDINPCNIFISNKGYTKISNFQSIERMNGIKTNDSGLSKIQWPYRSPELHCASNEYDYQVDIWALGIVLCQIFFNIHPFYGSDHQHYQEHNLFENILRVVGIPSKKWFEQFSEKKRNEFLNQMPLEYKNKMKEDKCIYFNLTDTLFQNTSETNQHYLKTIYYKPKLFHQIICLIQQCFQFTLTTDNRNITSELKKSSLFVNICCTCESCKLIKDSKFSCFSSSSSSSIHKLGPIQKNNQKNFTEYQKDLLLRVISFPKEAQIKVLGGLFSSEVIKEVCLSIAAKLFHSYDILDRRYRLAKEANMKIADFNKLEVQIMELLEWNF